MPESPDARQYAPATLRNREPILDVLLQFLPPTGTILEISSGTGEHSVFFAPRLYPRKWRACHPAENLYNAIALDVRDPIWAVEKEQLPASLSGLDLIENPIVAIVNINMIHISPFSACLGLMAGARRILPKGGILYLYGLFKINGNHTAPSNEAFDCSLRMQNPEWGVRNLDEVVAVAEAQNLSLIKTVTMPANNLSVIFQA
jgi:Protein of unknown function (DUF938)